MMSKFSLINFVIFQACWFTAALYQQSGTLTMLGLLIIHFLLSPTKYNDVKVLLLALLGCSVDQFLYVLGVLEFTTYSAFIPTWLVLLWCCFVLSLNHSLHWLVKSPIVIQVILGGVFGSLSYFAALNFSALQTSLSSIYFVIVIAVTWAIVLPTFCVIFRELLFPQNKKLHSHT